MELVIFWLFVLLRIIIFGCILPQVARRVFFSTCNDVYASVLSVSIFIAYIGQLWVENWFDHFRNMCYIQFDRLLLSDRFVDMF